MRGGGEEGRGGDLGGLESGKKRGIEGECWG